MGRLLASVRGRSNYTRFAWHVIFQLEWERVGCTRKRTFSFVAGRREIRTAEFSSVTRTRPQPLRLLERMRSENRKTGNAKKGTLNGDDDGGRSVDSSKV
jgi:hypothetical protein